MAKVSLWRNPFKWKEVESFDIEDGTRFIEWLTLHFPHGFGGNIKVTRNAAEFVCDEWDCSVKEHEHYGVYVSQADPITAQFIYPFYRWVKSQIPKAPGVIASLGAGESSYSLNKAQNSAKLGGPVPLCYGQAIVTPDYAAEPYYEVTGNDLYLKQILAVCAGGNNSIEGVYIGGTPVNEFATGDVVYDIYNKTGTNGATAHNQAFGVIGSGSGIYEDVFTVAAAEGLEPDQLAAEDQSAAYIGGFGAYGGVALASIVTTDDMSIYEGSSAIPQEGADAGKMFIVSGITQSESSISGSKIVEFADCVGTSTFGENQITSAVCSITGNVITSDTILYVIPHSILLITIPGVITNKLVAVNSITYGIGEIIITIDGYSVSGTYSMIGGSIQESTRSDGGYKFTTASAEWLGWYATNNKGKAISKIALNISFPGGLYSSDNSGNLTNNTATLVVQHQLMEINSSNTVGASIATIWSKTANTNDAIRDKIDIAIPDGYRARVRVLRIDPKSTSASSYSKMQVDHIQSYQRPTGETVYGDVTLIAMTIKAGSGTSSASSNKITVKTQSRQATPWNAAGTATSDARDAVYDMLTNTSYGAQLPVAAVDTDALSQVVGKYNGVIDAQSTLWVAIQSALAASFTYPSTIGDMVTFVQDVERDRSTVFSHANIINGSIKYGWQIDDLKEYDGFEVKWRDPDDWSEHYAIYPADCVNPESVDLRGCTDGTIALAHATKLWKKKLYQIETVSFDTEMEGFIPLYGQRVGVADVQFTESESGYIDAATSALSFISNVDLFTQGGAYCIIRSPLNVSSAVIACTVSGRTVTLSVAPSFSLESGIMFSIGEASDFVTDWVIDDVSDKGDGKTSVKLINYDTRCL